MASVTVQQVSSASSGRRRIVFIAAAAALALALIDQFTKELILRNIEFGTAHPVIDGFFNLTHVTNPGAAWSILAGKTWFLTSVSLAAFILILVFFKKLTDRFPERIFALALVCSGIAGNCFDRIFRGGEVVDFLQFHVGRFYWPSFNVADMCITTGVTVYVISNLFRAEKKP